MSVKLLEHLITAFEARTKKSIWFVGMVIAYWVITLFTHPVLFKVQVRAVLVNP
jgi:hypothetical protein